MIEGNDVMPLILEACPSFVPIWRDIESKHAEEDGWRLHYVDAGYVADHLVALLEVGQVDEVAATMRVIERLHVEGDHYVSELATIGYLEDIQNMSRRSPSLGPEAFLPLLGPESREGWDYVIGFWAMIAAKKAQQPD